MDGTGIMVWVVGEEIPTFHSCEAEEVERLYKIVGNMDDINHFTLEGTLYNFDHIKKMKFNAVEGGE